MLQVFSYSSPQPCLKGKPTGTLMPGRCQPSEPGGSRASQFPQHRTGPAPGEIPVRPPELTRGVLPCNRARLFSGSLIPLLFLPFQILQLISFPRSPQQQVFSSPFQSCRPNPAGPAQTVHIHGQGPGNPTWPRTRSESRGRHVPAGSKTLRVLRVPDCSIQESRTTALKPSL